MENKLASAVGFEKDETELGIPRRFESIARLNPEKIAIDDSENRLNYKDINELANKIARHIIELSNKDDQLVGLLFHNASESIVAMFAALKAGKAYVVIDPSEPIRQSSTIVRNSCTQLIVTNSDNVDIARQLMPDKRCIINIDQITPATPTTNLNLDLNGDSLAAVYYTSGSAGRSKGVMRSHRTLLHRAWFDCSDFHIDSRDKISFLYDYRFSASSVDIFASLLTGATLFPFDIKAKSQHQFARWLIEKRITILHPPLAYIRELFLENYSNIQLKELRVLSVGGDRMHSKDALKIYQSLPELCKFYYRYSCSEASLITRWYLDPQALSGLSMLPVGFPISDKQLKIFDETGQEVDSGVVGEIAVRSRYLSVGYWNDQDLSAKKFRSVDAATGDKTYLTGDMGRMQLNGCLEHLGRKDSMVKIRGFRVELETIDRALMNLPGIRDAVVVAHELRDASHRLVAYVVCTDGNTPSHYIPELRKALAETMPEYMIPTQFVTLDSLPLTATGKPDRQALPLPDHQRSALSVPYAKPTTPFEDILCDIWSEVLGHESIGIHDPYIDLGGNSLQAMSIATRVQQRFNVQIPTPTLFDASTVAEMALLVLTSLVAQEPAIVPDLERLDD